MQKVVEGILTNYEVIGERKKDLLILHGWGGKIDDWTGLAGELGKRHKVWLLDLPGHGGSGMPPKNWGIYEYGEFTQKFLESFGINKVIALGHSFGGRIGILLAARAMLVERLILVDAAGMETRSWKSSLLTFIAPMLRWFPDSWRKWVRSEDYHSSGEMKETYRKVVGEDLRNDLESVQCQTLIVWGERDKVLPFVEARMLHEGIKGSVLRVVWGAGHWPHLEKPKDLLQILEEEGI